MQCLGLDIGSTTIKGAVFDLERNRLGTMATRPFPAPIAGLPSGWFEVSPVEIEEQAAQVIHSLLAAAPEAKSIFVSGQMGGVLLTDASGEPLTNYLSWRDQRTLGEVSPGLSYLHAVRQRWGDGVPRALGNELQPGSATSLLYWLATNGKLPTDAIPTTVADYVIRRLCHSQPSMHITQAIGMLELRTSAWHHEAFELLGLKHARLPELSHDVQPRGRLQFRGRSLPVFGAYGDQQCALFGAGLQPDELSINISTGSQVSLRTASFEPGQYQSRRYFDGDWLNTVTHLPAGRSLNVLIDLLTELAAAEGVVLKDPWGSVIRKAAEVAETNLQADLCFFAGPLGSAGRIEQITTESLTVGQLFHAAFRSMADNYARLAAWLDPSQAWKSLVFSGGLTQAVPLLREMIQNRFRVPARESVGEETLWGLLALARQSVGRDA